MSRKLASEQRSLLSERQLSQLQRPINPRRVLSHEGHMHLAAYETRAHLIRLFGFGGWDGEVLDVEQLYENRREEPGRDDKPSAFKVSVGYRARYRLRVYGYRLRMPRFAAALRPLAESSEWLQTRLAEVWGVERVLAATYTESAAGGATNFPDSKRADAHDFAIKTAESQAMKRCAMNLGDQFGLSLYAKAAADAVVGTVLAGFAEQGELTENEPDNDLQQPEDTNTPEAEEAIAWVAAAAAAPDQKAFDRLYNEARAKKVKPALLKQMREASPHAEGEA